ncbi:MAG TPA: DNA-processing protein DprA [Candidatus Brocadiia bacterium]|nr:DNA-processing protein DprA [Candidatus Brocadiales bacterium]
MEGIGNATYQKLLERFNDPETILLDATEEEILTIPRINKRIAKSIISARERIEQTDGLIEGLNRSNIKIITSNDHSYPERIKILKNPPALLYMLGEYKNTQKKVKHPPSFGRAVAIVGSTMPSQKGYKIAKECAKRLVRKGYTIVSGYAKGIDTAAHLGALEAGGTTIMAIPTGISHFRVRLPFNSTIVKERAVVISESFPTQNWTVGAAMSRNKLIVALSDAVIIAETRAKGGSMTTFNIAKQLGIKTFTIKYSNPPPSALGNSILLEQGAIPISRLSDIEYLT